MGGSVFDGSPREVGETIRRQEAREIRIGTITISRDAVGEYWASFQIGSETPFREAFPLTGSIAGHRPEHLELVVDSDGNVLENPKFLKKFLKKLARAQHKLSRMAEHAKKAGRLLSECKNYQKQRQKVAYLNRRIARQREDYLHTYSRHEVESQDLIAAEDLNVGSLKRNHKLARAISDAGWRELLTMLAVQGKAVRESGDPGPAKEHHPDMQRLRTYHVRGSKTYAGCPGVGLSGLSYAPQP